MTSTEKLRGGALPPSFLHDSFKVSRSDVFLVYLTVDVFNSHFPRLTSGTDHRRDHVRCQVTRITTFCALLDVSLTSLV